MHTSFEQIIRHKCVFVPSHLASRISHLASRIASSRTASRPCVLASRIEPSRPALHMRAAQRDLVFCRHILFPASLLWSPRNISLEWTM